MDNKVVGTALMVAGAVVIIPMAINGIYKLGCCAYVGAANGINQVKFNRQMKKGIKEGRIVKFDGEYYNVGDTKGEA